jgi:hypothetical protein
VQASDVREHAVERARHATEIERLDQRPGELDLPVREEAAELLLRRPASMRQLLLVGTKRAQVPVFRQDFLDSRGTQTANELVLEIPVAHVEAEPFHLRAAKIATKAAPLERAAQSTLLSRVAEADEHDGGSIRAIELQKPADRLRAADRHHRNALSYEIPAAARGKRLQCDLVAHPLDQHDRARLHGEGSCRHRRFPVCRPRGTTRLMADRKSRREQNQMRFRTGNEALHDAVESIVPEGRVVPFLCECADDHCLGEVEVTLAAWEGVAAQPNHFLMLAGHQRSEGEDVVGTLGQYEIARKQE